MKLLFFIINFFIISFFIFVFYKYLGGRADGDFLENGAALADDDSDGLVGELDFNRDVMVHDFGGEIVVAHAAHLVLHTVVLHLIDGVELVAVTVVVEAVVLLLEIVLLHLVAVVLHLLLLRLAVTVVLLEIVVAGVVTGERSLGSAVAVGLAVAGAVAAVHQLLLAVVLHGRVGERTRDVHVLLEMRIVLDHLADLGAGSMDGFTGTGQSDDALLNGGDLGTGRSRDAGARAGGEILDGLTTFADDDGDGGVGYDELDGVLGLIELIVLEGITDAIDNGGEEGVHGALLASGNQEAVVSSREEDLGRREAADGTGVGLERGESGTSLANDATGNRVGHEELEVGGSGKELAILANDLFTLKMNLISKISKNKSVDRNLELMLKLLSR